MTKETNKRAGELKPGDRVVTPEGIAVVQRVKTANGKVHADVFRKGVGTFLALPVGEEVELKPLGYSVLSGNGWSVAIVDSPWLQHNYGNFNSDPGGVLCYTKEKAEAVAAELNASNTVHKFEARRYYPE